MSSLALTGVFAAICLMILVASSWWPRKRATQREEVR